MADPGNEDDLEDFLNDGGDENDVGIVLEGVNLKSESILKNYSLSLDTYKSLDSKDPLKQILKAHIETLLGKSLFVIDQFDFAILGDDDDD